MISTRVLRFIFLISLFMAIGIPFAFSDATAAGFAYFVAEFINNIPGINAISRSAQHSVAHSIGIGFAIFSALINLFLVVVSDSNILIATQRISGYSSYKRFTFGIFAVIIAIFPWLIATDNSKVNQISSEFFRLANDNLLIFSLLCGGIYVYTFSCLLFSIILLKGSKNDD